MPLPLRRQLMPWLVCVLCAAASAAWSAERLEPPGVAWPTTGWQESTPEQQGMASLAVRRLVDFGAKNGMDSLLVIRHGTVVADAYYAPYRAGLKHHLYSATKGVLGTLTGIAVQDGLLKGVTQPVVDFFPDRMIAPDDARRKTITIDHLLDMTSGMDWKEPLDGAPETLRAMRRSPHWSAFVLDRPMAQAPGAAFNYSSGNSQLLSSVLTRATGKSAADFAQTRLFDPLGIRDTLWRKDPNGDSIGGFGLYMHPRDMAKIGYLYLHHGEWDGRRLLPPRWTEKVFHATVDMRMGSPSTFRYANGWWTLPQQDVYMAVGFLQQIIMVIPRLDLVVVVTGKKPPRFGPLIDLLEAACTSPQALPPAPGAHADLVRRVQEAAAEKSSPVETLSATAAAVTGRTYRFDRNAMGLSALTLDLRTTNPQYEMLFNGSGATTGVQRFAGPVGLDGTFRADVDRPGPLLAARATWTDAATLFMVSQWLTDGVVATYTLRFGDNVVDIDYRDNTGADLRLHGFAQP